MKGDQRVALARASMPCGTFSGGCSPYTTCLSADGVALRGGFAGRCPGGNSARSRPSGCAPRWPAALVRGGSRPKLSGSSQALGSAAQQLGEAGGGLKQTLAAVAGQAGLEQEGDRGAVIAL